MQYYTELSTSEERLHPQAPNTMHFDDFGHYTCIFPVIIQKIDENNAVWLFANLNWNINSSLKAIG